MPEPIPISWAHDQRRLAQSRNYWLATVRPDGRPHIAPVWGVWVDGLFHFVTARTTTKGRNLAACPHAALHLDNSEDVLVVEGAVAPADSPALRERVDAALSAKYVTIRSGRPYQSAMNPEAQLWTLTPAKAMAWWEMAMDQTSRRWRWTGAPEPAPTPDWHPLSR
jgi:Pyridoxamine 5'-phosphate oxidase